ncbi:MAG: Maf family protein [Parvularculaceae bacterium]
MTAPRLVLASGSTIRRDMLAAAGLAFDVRPSGVDEDAIKAAATADRLSIDDLALRLAEAKARAVATAGDLCNGDLVIGADQILDCDGEAFDKPIDLAAAHGRLRALAGRAHDLVNGAVVVRVGADAPVYRRGERATLKMRDLRDDEIEAYLAAAGPTLLSSVGGYMVEGLGARLFERIDGSYFTVLGLSLLPLLDFLRREADLPF